MSYLKEFQMQIANRDLDKFLQLWEEYCTCDTADVEELTELLKTIKKSEFAKSFGKHVETILPLWSTITSEEEAYAVLRLLIDLQTINSSQLAELALEAIKKRYEKEDHFQERLRLVGLRTRENFQGALSNFDLLVHAKQGNFVFHQSGWGVGEILEQSAVREQLAVEFENVTGIKHVTLANAFKTLIPLSSDHFLARRFSDPDKFEKEARENPVEVIKILLRDLGPKTASEIKDELCELVIPEKDWQKWWQNVRAKLKKDTSIESPENIRDPFMLRKLAISHESQFLESLAKAKSTSSILLACYNFIRDHGVKAKMPEVKSALVASLQDILKTKEISLAELLQAYFCLDLIQENAHENEISESIRTCQALDELIKQIDILAFKKQALVSIKAFRNDWHEVFVHLLHTVDQSPLRDFIFKELLQNAQHQLLDKALKELLLHPWKNPELFLWYFLKLMNEESSEIPYATKEGREQYAESFLILLHRIENQTDFKELVKRLYNTLSNKRYALVRKLFDKSNFEFAKEFLLLASKCHTLSDADLKILRSLAEVVHPSLGDEDKRKQKSQADARVFWATQAGYLNTQERIKHLGTKEVVDNAKEIETARALGDLRENSEYKSALERRSRLQSEIKVLSEQLSKARIITPEDISPGEVSVGSIVHTRDSQGNQYTYTLLGPWEADPEKNILSIQSKLAQSMMGLHLGDHFKFKDEEYTISKIGTIFDT